MRAGVGLGVGAGGGAGKVSVKDPALEFKMDGSGLEGAYAEQQGGGGAARGRQIYRLAVSDCNYLLKTAQLASRQGWG